MSSGIGRGFLLSLVLFCGVNASASLVMPSDGPYYRLRRDQVLYVYDGTSADVVPQIEAFLQAVRANYDQSFAWRLDEEQDLILTSPNQQIADAYATITPNIKSVWYPAGSGLLDSIAESSWFLALVTHETSHLYQLDAKAPLPASLKKFFGNTGLLIPFVWPLSLSPNLYTPTFLLEGNAVLNESRANIGGRLYSGEVRAMVLAQIRAGEITPARLINDEFRFPFGDNAYFQGGYFAAHLATKYGVDKANQFFLAQSEHYLWPLILNATFRDHFGASYAQEIREYVREWDGLAKAQRYFYGKPMVETTFVGPLNHDAHKVFFLATDGNGLSELYTFAKDSDQVTHSTVDLAMGKVFFAGGQPTSASSEQHDLHHIEYSLYGEGHAFDPRYRGQIVNDQRAGKTVALNAVNSWLEPQVLLNGEPYDVGHSSPILDEAGNVYYFRQNGSERILYKNRQPVFKYEGFYGKAMEIDPSDGTFYFIACSDSGATLYAYKNNEIYRVLSSDRVVDARMVAPGRFLATEIEPSGYRVSVEDGTFQPAVPAMYSYGFATYHLTPQKLEDADQAKADARSYNAFSQMRYSSLDMVTSYNSYDGLGIYADAHFADPLQYQSIDAGFSGSELQDQQYFAQYTFTKYLPQIFTNYSYRREYWSQFNGLRRAAYDQLTELGVQLPFLRWQHWDANVSLAADYFHDDQRIDPSAPGASPAWQPNVADTYGEWSSVNFQYSENPDPFIGYYPYRLFFLNVQNRLQSEPGEWRKKYNTSLVQSEWQMEFGNQYYATVAGDVGWAENHDLTVGYNPQPLAMDIRIPRLVAGSSFSVKSASSARFEFSKVYQTSSYSARIPLGLDRVAPVGVLQGMFFDSDGAGYSQYPANIYELGFGGDFQLLLLHTIPAKLRIMTAVDTRLPQRQDLQAHLLMHYRF